MMKSKHLVKRGIAAAIAGTMVIGSMSMTAFADEADSISWEYANGKLTISGTGEIAGYDPAGGIVSPWYDRRYEITEIEISDGITGIGDYAFYECTGLTDVVIPESLTAIGNSAFECCYSLADFGTDADVSGVVIPEGVETIGKNAFFRCNGISDVYFYNPDLGGYVFDDETTPGDGSFDFNSIWGTKLHVLGYINPSVDDGTFVNIWYRQNPYANCVVPDIEVEGHYSISLPRPAWNGSVAADKTAAAPGDEVVLTAQPNDGFVPDIKVFAGADEIAVTEIGENLYSFTMPASDVRVDAQFVQGFAITIGNIVNGEVRVEKNFAANASIVKVEVIPDAGYLTESVTYTAYGNLNTIEADENGVYSFVMPWDNVTISAAFAVDENYDPDEMPEAHGQCGESVYWNLTDGVLTIFGEGDMCDFNGEEEAPWAAESESITKVVFGKNITGIGAGACHDCPNLTETVFEGQNIKRINYYAFGGCYSLEEIAIPEGVETIGPYSFAYCTSLKKASVPDSAVTIDDAAFSYCYALSDLRIGNGVKHIISAAFYNCTGLLHVDIPDSVEDIGCEAFGRCRKLKSVNIGNGVKYIGVEAFDEDALEELVIPAGVEVIEFMAFGYNKNLKEIYLYASDFSGYDKNAFFETAGDCVMHIPEDVEISGLSDETGGAPYYWYVYD